MVKFSFSSSDGFTFPELLVAAMLLATAVVGLLLSYTKMIELQELSRNTTIAIEGMKDQVEMIKSTTFGLIPDTYDARTFSVTGLTGVGVTNVTVLEVDFLEIWVTYSWQQKNGRVIGEDQNLNGVLDAGEDANGNGFLDSPAQFVTFVYAQ